MGRRRQSREAGLKLLYALDITRADVKVVLRAPWAKAMMPDNIRYKPDSRPGGSVIYFLARRRKRSKLRLGSVVVSGLFSCGLKEFVDGYVAQPVVLGYQA